MRENRSLLIDQPEPYRDAGCCVCFVTGRHTSPYPALRTLDGTRLHESVKAADLTLPEMRKDYIQEREDRQFLSAFYKAGLLAE